MYRTVKEQKSVETQILEKRMHLSDNYSNLYLLREEHVSFLENCLNSLPKEFESLSSSQPWILYWILHSLELLDIQIDSNDFDNAVEYIRKCQSPSGGFGGGPGQSPHLGNTYAAICVLAILGKIDKKAYEVIDRKSLKQFIVRCRNRDGSFKMAIDSETDLRAVYCAFASAKMCHIFTPEIYEGTATYIAKCQSFDGGFGAVPGAESHAGYTFCGVAALAMLDITDDSCESLYIDKYMLLRWITHRQMAIEGGFQGRTHKLVDSCYSYWIGSIFYMMFGREFIHGDDNFPQHMLSRQALQTYILNNCQYPNGGLIDKPGKKPDIYHTCYALSGLSLSQLHPEIEFDKFNITERDCDYLERNHPIYNVCEQTFANIVKYFLAKSPIV